MKSSEGAAVEPPDRRTGLVLFGVLDFLVAMLYLIRMLALAFISIAGANPRPSWTLAEELPVSALLALLPAVFFMTLGIGSILGRRWARSLSLVFSALWLALGVLTVACLLLVIPRIVSVAGTRAPLASCGAIALFGILLPGSYVLFYRSPGVKAQCEWLDPQQRWTDRCPGPVLALVMLLVVGASLALGLGFSATRQMLFFGHVLDRGLRLAFAGAAAVQLVIAWALSRRRRWAWIASIAFIAARLAGHVLIVRHVTIDGIERVTASLEKLRPRDKAILEALRPLNLSAAVIGWILLIGLLEIAIAIRAGEWFRETTAI